MSQFQVDPAQVRAHADAVGSHADRLSSVAGGLSDGLAENSLGPFVQFLTAGLSNAMGQTSAALAHASSALGDVRTGLLRTADGYQRTDEFHAGQLRREDPS